MRYTTYLHEFTILLGKRIVNTVLCYGEISEAASLLGCNIGLQRGKNLLSTYLVPGAIYTLPLLALDTILQQVLCGNCGSEVEVVC